MEVSREICNVVGVGFAYHSNHNTDTDTEQRDGDAEWKLAIRELVRNVTDEDEPT